MEEPTVSKALEPEPGAGGGKESVSPKAALKANFGGKTAVLVVDDEKLIRLTVGAKLKSAGYATMAAGSVDEAVAILNENPGVFTAIVSDIMMGDMDGFAFRSIVRGIDTSMPFFFMTALDPEEGSGFLKRIVEDPMSYYLPKSAGTDIMVKRIQRIVASRRVERFIERQMNESRQSLALAAHIQRSMLPCRAYMDARFFYTALWEPKETVSGDLYEALPFGDDAWLFVLGDIQGHGTSAALAMTAVQSFLKNLRHDEGDPAIGPEEIANMLQRFFRDNLAEVSYMTVAILVYDMRRRVVRWISCGAPDPIFCGSDRSNSAEVNPDRRGGIPIGLMPGTVYTRDDVVVTAMPDDGVCMVVSDGLFDISRDEEGIDKITMDNLREVRKEIMMDCRTKGSILSEPYKHIEACSEYSHLQDDVTILLFGPRIELDGIYDSAVPLTPSDIDEESQRIGSWCRAHGLETTAAARVQLVLEEMMMNVYDHGFDDRERLREVAFTRVRLYSGMAELTIWDCGRPVPSLAVAAGDSATAFAIKNLEKNNHGRGRLMVRELCDGIERKRFGSINETVYHVRLSPGEGEKGTSA